MGALSAAGGITAARWLLGIAAICAAGAVVCAARPDLAAIVLTVNSAVMVIASIAFWRRGQGGI
jgi:hypothetical protein